MEQRKSIWETDDSGLTREGENRPRLTDSIKKDVIVIGGGMAGILTAWFLQRKGADVAVVEAAGVGSGQTAHTTAKITWQHGLIYAWLTQKLGPEAAGEYARAGQQAAEDYQQIIQGERIDCDFKRLPAYLYTKDRIGDLEDEAMAARLCGIDCKIQKETELPFPVAGALRFDGQASFHPLKFLRAVSEKLEIYENSPVLEMDGCIVTTPEGSAEGKSVILASHFPFINVPGYYFLKTHQERSYVLALERAQRLRGMYYGIDPGLSWSMRSAGDCLLLGGAGHRTGFIPKQDPYTVLRETAEAFWPGASVVESWSAQDCVAAGRLPYIGPFSKSTPGLYVATGFGKWGMVHSMISARVLTNEIMGTARRKKTIFDPGKRKLSTGLAAILKNGAVSTKNLMASWAGVRPKCPHLGCRLHWNPWESTWECQCHGSRFGEDGSLLADPAQTKLDFD